MNHQLFADAVDRINHVKFVRHDSPESVEAALWQLPVEELAGGTIGAIDTELNEIELTHEQVMEAHREDGRHGFADAEKGEIHYWVDPKTPQDQIVHFLAHELCHIARATDADQRQSDEQCASEELECEIAGTIAAAAAAFTFSVDFWKPISAPSEPPDGVCGMGGTE